MSLNDVFAMNATTLIRAARKILKNPMADDGARPLRIALTGSGNLDYLGLGLLPFFVAEGFAPTLYVSPFDGFRADALNPQSRFSAFKPDVGIVYEDYRDFLADRPPLGTAPATVSDIIDRLADERVARLEALAVHSGASLYLCELVIPNRRADGAFSANDPAGLHAFLRELNRATALRLPKTIRRIDFDAVASDYGKNDWFDDSAYFLSKQPLALTAIPTAARAIAMPILSARGAVRKCLVLDLDNTLWGGVVGDDGLFGIRLEPNDALGEAFRDFQRTVLAYKARGVLLAVNSKNSAEIAREPFEANPYCLLKLDDFAAFYANWDDKALNMERIARDLNISTNALVFFDDNPVERERVRSALPDVLVIDTPDDPANYSTALDAACAFDWDALTDEDRTRTETFIAERKRGELRASAVSYEDYLRDLEMRGSVAPVEEGEFDRFIQLFNKTNQFNLNGIRRTPEEIQSLANDPDAAILRVTLSDRLSRYGIISALILTMDRAERTMTIDGWVTSCRVFNRTLDAFTVNELMKLARKNGCETITAKYAETAKNGMMPEVLQRNGFKKDPETGAVRLKVEEKPLETFVMFE